MIDREESTEVTIATPSQRKLIDFVKQYATVEGGKTKDVVSHGDLTIRTGITLIAEIIDGRLPGDDSLLSDEDLAYSLSIIDDQSTPIESIDVEVKTHTTGYTFDEAEPYEDEVPDYAIDSFFDRYGLTEAA